MSRNVFQGEPEDSDKEKELAKIDLGEELAGWPERVPDILMEDPAVTFKKGVIKAFDEAEFKKRGTSIGEHRRKQHETLQELYNEENKEAEARLGRTPPKPYQVSRVCSCTGDAHVKGTRPSCPPNA